MRFHDKIGLHTIMYDKGVAGVTFAATNSIFSSHGNRHCSKSDRISGRAV